MSARFPVAALALTLVLAACAPVVAFDPNRLPDAADLGPKPSETEWWYVSGSLPESGLAFHWAQFKVNYRGVAFTTAHVAVTDLNTGKVQFLEKNDGGSAFGFPPLSVRQGEWTLVQRGNVYELNAGPLRVTLAPQKPPVVHPPGYSGTAEVGRLYYQSITRLGLEGTIDGKPARGVAWLDHQWGDQLPGRAALWDWFGLHLSNGVDLMMYRVRNAEGKIVQLAGSWVDPSGVAREVKNFRATPRETWTSPTGRRYVLSWDLEADGLKLRIDPRNKDQELLSRTTFVAYWEGAVTGRGEWNGEPVTAEGMGEFVGGALTAR